jgi:ATP-binding cassette, subfamily B, bacterial
MKLYTKKTLGYYWHIAKRHWPSGLLMTGAMFVATVLDLIAPLYYKQLFNVLADSGQTVGNLTPVGADTVFKTLLGLFIIIISLKLAGLFLRRLNNFTANYFESKAITELGDLAFAEIHKRSFSFFNDSFIGSLTKKVKYFTGAFEAICDRFVWNFMPLVVTIVVIIGVLFTVNVNLALGMIVWLVSFMLINWIFTKFKMKYDLARTNLETEITGLLADTLTNNSNVKLFNGYRREIKTYADTNEKVRRARRLSWDLGSIFDTAQGFLMALLEIGMIGYAIYLWRQGQFTVGDFALIQSYVGNIMNRMWDFGNIIRWTYQNLADAEEMTEILETPPEIVDAPDAKKLKVKAGAIEFKKVNFKYKDGQDILKNFSLMIPANQRLAIIGPSGAGKTTVVKLLFRMHDLSGGEALIDGQNIAKVTQESLWQNVALVPQDPILFHRTLKDNIRYGKADATEAEVIAAAKAAHCHEFIVKLEKGYDTFVGERGVKLSGGERQRVAIARAILKNAPILILDEATSSLDSESERLIQDALDRLMKDKTVIVVAHRLSTIRKMDRIITVDKGRIIEDGSHNQLLKNPNGTYNRLWKLQAGGFIE